MSPETKKHGETLPLTWNFAQPSKLQGDTIVWMVGEQISASIIKEYK